MSNFNWTDKESIRWFILLPTGHEGPYSFNQLLNKNIHPQTKIWAEGLNSPYTFSKAKDAIVLAEMPQLPSEDIIPPFPPDEDPPPIPDDIPDLPIGKTEEIESFRWKSLLLFISILGCSFLLYQIFQNQKVVGFSRPSKMSPKLYEKIRQEMKFGGWDKKIFFKEYVSSDLSTIWLITESFHYCHVEAAFSSLENKLITNSSEKVSFRADGELKGHVLEFKKYAFTEGNRILPGMYDIFIKAEGCKWDGWAPILGNFFNSPDQDYVANFKVVLYPNGPIAYNEILTKLLKKKLDEKMKSEHHEQMFWEDLQQKLQTIMAISLQVEQSFYDFIGMDARKFEANLPRFISSYTKNFGHFLTNFVVSNEEYFKELQKAGHVEMGAKRKYEAMIRLTAKSVGLESMKVIEEFQKLKGPKRVFLNSKKIQIKKNFERIKNDINKKLIQITEERSKNN